MNVNFQKSKYSALYAYLIFANAVLLVVYRPPRMFCHHPRSGSLYILLALFWSVSEVHNDNKGLLPDFNFIIYRDM